MEMATPTSSQAPWGLRWVYMGGPSGLGNTAVASLAAGATGAYEYEVAAAGDVDSDGYDDVVASYDQVFLYRGGPSGLATSPSLTFSPPSPSPGIYGFVSAGAGDLDGDGRADLAIGSASDSNFVGKVFVYLGQADGVASSPVSVLAGSDGAGGEFGACVK